MLQEVNEDEAVVDVTAPNPPVDENIKSLKKKILTGQVHSDLGTSNLTTFLQETIPESSENWV